MEAARAELDALVEKEVQRIRSANEGVVAGGQSLDCSTVVYRQWSSPQNRDLLRRALGSAQALKTWDEEPHLRYLLLRGEQAPVVRLPTTGGGSDSFMRLALDAPEKPYKSSEVTSRCLHSTVHIGQRKLLIGEVLFLVEHGSKSNVVVYIGAASGQHIPALSELFPQHRFLLYDPSPFSKPLIAYMREHPGRISIYNELFPPAAGSVADRELKMATGGDTGFLLISDIRRRDESSDMPTNEDVQADMNLQIDICKAMEPKAAHLKCRLPYLELPTDADTLVEIPRGSIYFQPWSGHQSTETRLVLEPPWKRSPSGVQSLSSRWYESALHYHNTVSRYSRYIAPQLAPLDVFLGTIYDQCFDCTFERYTIWLYLTAVGTASHSPGEYNTFVSIYMLFKRVLGREDERLLLQQEQRPRR